MEEVVQLFCIPYAGGKAELFQQFASCMPETVSVIPIEYAGHGNRIREPFYETFSAMAADVAAEIRKLRDPSMPYALFGYSMGSVVAYEIATRGLLTEQPARLFFASHEAPGTSWDSMDYAEVDDLTFARLIVEFGGFDRFEEKFLQNKFFRKMIFQPIREDYRLIADYHWEEVKPLTIPASFFYAPEDVAPEKAKLWQQRFKEPMEFFEIGENHFFIREHAEELAKIIEKQLATMLGKTK